MSPTLKTTTGNLSPPFRLSWARYVNPLNSTVGSPQSTRNFKKSNILSKSIFSKSPKKSSSSGSSNYSVMFLFSKYVFWTSSDFLTRSRHSARKTDKKSFTTSITLITLLSVKIKANFMSMATQKLSTSIVRITGTPLRIPWSSVIISRKNSRKFRKWWGKITNNS